MQRINASYRALIEAAGTRTRHDAQPQEERSAPSGRRLSQEEVERLVNALGTESWVQAYGRLSRHDWLLRGYERDRDQWEVTPKVAAMLVQAAGLLLLLLLDRSGVQLSKGGVFTVILFFFCLSIGAVFSVRRRGGL